MRLLGYWPWPVTLMAFLSRSHGIFAQESSQVENIRLDNSHPPYSLKCGSLVFKPLQESCGFQNGDLVNLIIGLMAGNTNIEPEYPPESCYKECSDAVLGVVRTSEDCQDVKQWLPIGTTDLRQLMGETYSLACADQVIEFQTDTTTAKEEMEADLQCAKALESCELVLPESDGLLMSKLQTQKNERIIMDNWSCPETCSTSNITLLLTERCVKVLLVRSVVKRSWELRVSVQLEGNPLVGSEVQEADIASLLSLLGGDKGLDHVCMRTISPTGEQVQTSAAVGHHFLWFQAALDISKM
jgi:hypothetical protein